MRFFRRNRTTFLLAIIVVLFVVAPIAVAPAYAAESPCGATSFWTQECITYGMASAAESWLSLVAHLVWAAGILLNVSTIHTVIEMGANVSQLSAIDTAWSAFRDLSNIILIFIMIAIGIGTILRVEQYGAKRLLAKVIIIALLLNFSLFFTKFLIDGTNLFAAQFWNNIAIEKNEADAGISNAFMAAMRLTSLYDVSGQGLQSQSQEGLRLAQTQGATLTPGGILAIAFFGSILFLVAAFVFFATAIMLITRFVVLILLMMVSPLAFVAMIIPGRLNSLAEKWWSSLIQYGLFAPAYFALTWASLTVLAGLRTTQGFGTAENTAAPFAGFALGQGGFAFVLLQFIVVITLMVASLIISKQLGVAGANGFIRIGRNAAGYAAATTAGRAFRGLRNVWTESVAQARNLARRGAGMAFTGTNAATGGRLKLATESKWGKFAGKLGRTAARPVTGILGGIDRGVSSALKAGEESKYGGSVSVRDIIQSGEKREQEISNAERKQRTESAINRMDRGQETKQDIDHLASLSKREIEEQKATRLATEQVAQYLSASQLENIAGSDKFTEQQKAQITEARFAQIMRNLTSDKREEAEAGAKALRGLSDKEVELLGEQNLRNEKVIENLTSGQLDAIKKSSKLNSNLKRDVQNDRKEYVMKVITSGSSEAFADLLNKMKPADIAKLDDDAFKQDRLLKQITPSIASEIVKEKSVGLRQHIRSEIEKAVQAKTATAEQRQTYDWLTKPNTETPFGVIF